MSGRRTPPARSPTSKSSRRSARFVSRQPAPKFGAGFLLAEMLIVASPRSRWSLPTQDPYAVPYREDTAYGFRRHKRVYARFRRAMGRDDVSLQHHTASPQLPEPRERLQHPVVEEGEEAEEEHDPGEHQHAAGHPLEMHQVVAVAGEEGGERLDREGGGDER